ncbi:MAG: hypothetical protein MZV64_14055 [Ignavibacteriales bacterium]|nr:hypothetical protein [Ignavibacteriales bacterium]
MFRAGRRARRAPRGTRPIDRPRASGPTRCGSSRLERRRRQPLRRGGRGLAAAARAGRRPRYHAGGAPRASPSTTSTACATSKRPGAIAEQRAGRRARPGRGRRPAPSAGAPGPQARAGDAKSPDERCRLSGIRRTHAGRDGGRRSDGPDHAPGSPSAAPPDARSRPSAAGPPRRNSRRSPSSSAR